MPFEVKREKQKQKECFYLTKAMVTSSYSSSLPAQRCRWLKAILAFISLFTWVSFFLPFLRLLSKCREASKKVFCWRSVFFCYWFSCAFVCFHLVVVVFFFSLIFSTSLCAHSIFNQAIPLNLFFFFFEVSLRWALNRLTFFFCQRVSTDICCQS